MIDLVRLSTHSFSQAPWGSKVLRVLAAAMDAVEPAAAIRQSMRRQDDLLIVGERSYDLNTFQRVFLIGAGKAATPMAGAAAQILGPHLSIGLVITKEGHGKYSLGSIPSTLEILEAGHPLPDYRGVRASRQLEDLLSQAGESDLIVCLISGGGSALLVSPADGLTLEELQSVTSSLLACGAEIGEINCLRKHLERLKGGGMARLAAPATMVAMVLSDVVGDPLDVIASGPCVPDPTTFRDAYQVLERYSIVADVPEAVRVRLHAGMRGEIDDTPKPGDLIFDKTQNLIIGSNRIAAQAAIHQARQEGLNTMLLTTYLQGEARHAGRALSAIARQIANTGEPLERPACLVAGGETTVTLAGNGLGGRNQELALSCVRDLDGLQDIAIVTLATDGGDGPSDAAGAVVTGETLQRGLLLGLSPENHLRRNDSYHYFEPLGDLIKSGPTQTNVNDLTFIFAF